MKKKILTVTLIIAIAAVAAVGTLAYFTDEEEAENVMQFGKVDVEFTEPAWDPMENHVLVPGVAIPKDPTIKLADDSLQSWVLMDVRLDAVLVNLMAENEEMSAEELLDALEASHTFRENFVNKWLTGIDHESWEIIGFKNTESEFILRIGYKTVFQPGDEVVFMTGIQMPETVTSEMIQNVDYNGEVGMGFKVYAVQAMPVNTLAEAAAVIPAL